MPDVRSETLWLAKATQFHSKAAVCQTNTSQPVPTCSKDSSLYSCFNTKHDNLNITKFWKHCDPPIRVAIGLLHLSAAWIQIIPAVNNLTKRMEIGHHGWTEIICFQSSSQNSCTLNTHFSTPKHLARNFSFTNLYF